MTARRRTFEVVHNIPSPYRLHLFRVMHDQLAARDYSLHVHFLARAHRDRRHWLPEAEAFGFPHSYWRDLGFTLAGKEWHLNPSLVAHVARRRPTILMVGGPWDSLTGAGMSLLARRFNSIAWFEGNSHTPGRVRGAALVLKRALLAGFRHLAVPGAEGARLVHLILGRRPCTRVLVLPNIVDEARFLNPQRSGPSSREELGVGGGERLAIWPARLIPAKGVLEFLSLLSASDVDTWKIAIVGDGPLRGEVERMIAVRGLSSSVRLLGSVAYESMPAFYQAASLFLLPSLHDPNPLSVVEALHSGLPLLVSNRIGNLPEALHHGGNGWSLEPSSPANVRETLREAFSTSSERLREMGAHSRRMAAFWSSHLAVQRFLDALTLPDG